MPRAPLLAALATAAPLAAFAQSPALQARIAALPTLLADPAAADDAFTPAFQAAIPAPQWHAFLHQLARTAGQPRTVDHVEPHSPTTATVEIAFDRALIALRLAIDPATHRIAGLASHGPVAPERTLPALLQAFRSLPGTVALAATRLGPTTPLATLNPDQPISVGSAFKLIVLAGLVRAIEAGDRRWTDTVPRGPTPLPAGRYAAAPPETPLTLHDLAHAMLATSDNSATDLLIATIGRGTIEALLPTLGITDPAPLRPFLTTAEAFKLKGLVAAGHTAWLGADEPTRRTLLAGPVAATTLEAVAPAFTGQPLSIDTVEWRLTPNDLNRVLDWLLRHTAAGPAAEARPLLAANPGLRPFAAAPWRFVGFKGGSEPGLLAEAFLLQHPDGTWLAVSAAWNDPAHPVDEPRFALLVERLVQTLLQP